VKIRDAEKALSCKSVNEHTIFSTSTRLCRRLRESDRTHQSLHFRFQLTRGRERRQPRHTVAEIFRSKAHLVKPAFGLAFRRLRAENVQRDLRTIDGDVLLIDLLETGQYGNRTNAGFAVRDRTRFLRQRFLRHRHGRELPRNGFVAFESDNHIFGNATLAQCLARQCRPTFGQTETDGAIPIPFAFTIGNRAGAAARGKSKTKKQEGSKASHKGAGYAHHEKETTRCVKRCIGEPVLHFLQ